ncbi:MAG TPA: hypothetical protein VK897_17965 [Anaerolineales bacterium]|nr:hypothetical protein [Anaerolineales bacterium]
MRLFSIINFSCVAVSIACMSLAYLLAGYWLVLLVFPVMAFFWMLQKNQPVFWLDSSFLLIYVVLAVVGMVIHLPVSLLVAGCTTALACWDLTIFQQGIASTQSLEDRRALAKHHLRSLTMAACLGLGLSLIASSINFRLPFLALVVLVLTAVGFLTYGLQSLVKKSN